MCGPHMAISRSTFERRCVAAATPISRHTSHGETAPSIRPRSGCPGCDRRIDQAQQAGLSRRDIPQREPAARKSVCRFRRRHSTIRFPIRPVHRHVMRARIGIQSSIEHCWARLTKGGPTGHNDAPHGNQRRSIGSPLRLNSRTALPMPVRGAERAAQHSEARTHPRSGAADRFLPAGGR